LTETLRKWSGDWDKGSEEGKEDIVKAGVKNRGRENGG
jgi:hypothetical protein